MRKPRPPGEPIDKGWMKVEIYLPNCICNGYVCCPYRRLLDVLNGISSTVTTVGGEFLHVSKAEMHFPRRSEAVESFCINKADILFVSETEHKSLPLVPKFFTSVKLRMPPYTLIGQVHYPKGRCVRDVLNSMFRFFPMTNVEVCSLAGCTELEVNFLAVNKERILALEELGDSVKGI